MAFDIYQLDDLEDRDHEAIESFSEELIGLFIESPEGQAHQQTTPNIIGFWTGRLIDYGYSYCGETIPHMGVGDVEELLTDIFPRKISIDPDEDTQDAIPELVAFWSYLNRAYQLPQAEPILRYLRGISPETFHGWLMDPARFGMAKSFMMGGNAAGFDMSNPEEYGRYAVLHNAMAMAQDSGIGLPLGESRSKKSATKAKRTRKLAKASRKKNRKRK